MPADSPVNERASGGLALLDADGDGHLDVLLATGYSLTNLFGASSVGAGPQQLLLGDGTGRFEKAGASVLDEPASALAVTAGDFDGDGDADMLVPRADEADGETDVPSPDVLVENVDGELVERGSLAPEQSGTPYGICAADFDGDGDLDVFLAQHSDVDSMAFDGANAIGQRDRLFRNDGDFDFVDVTGDAGSIARARAWSNACMAHDYDGDGDLDLWVAYENHPRGVTLHRNDGNMQFTDVSEEALGELTHRVGNWMGFAAGDYDADGDVDVFVTNMGVGAYSLGGTTVTRQPNGSALHMLLQNRGDGTYVDVAPETPVDTSYELPSSAEDYPEAAEGLAGLDFGWTAWFVDYDNDGDEDLYFAGAWAISEHAQIIGTPRTGANPGRLLENDGSGSFRDVTEAAGVRNTDEEGFILNGWGNRFADVDANGFPDLLLVNQWFDVPEYPGSLRVWLNEGNDNSWLDVALEPSSSGPGGYGCRLELFTDRGVQVRERVAASSISAQDRRPVHFGVPAGARIDKLVVRWPSGRSSEVTSLQAGRRIVVEEPDS